jgi:hypothetical protein
MKLQNQQKHSVVKAETSPVQYLATGLWREPVSPAYKLSSDSSQLVVKREVKAASKKDGQFWTFEDLPFLTLSSLMSMRW